MASSTKRNKEPWRTNNERHYCKVCNSWLASDKQSILLHENGRKHKEKVEESMLQKRSEKLQEDQSAKLLAQSLQQMESSAMQAHAQDAGLFANSGSAPYPPPANRPVYPYPIPSAGVPPPPPPPPPPQPRQPQQQQPNIKQELSAWETRKQQRQDEKQRKREGDDSDSDAEEQPISKRMKLSIQAGEGHYINDSKTYLEGPTFGDILEEDMPVQIWTGNPSASLAEKCLLERDMHWKNGLVAAVRQRRSTTVLSERLVADIAYLKAGDDAEEILEKSVPLDRIRIILGADDSIPDTLEEARLLAMGGEEIAATEKQEQDVDENTGLSSWSTVTIKRTTVRQELKEERTRMREKRRESAEEEDKQKKETEFRKMEEAKVANADDSALGAYDVWSRTKDGYKGVDIHGEAAVDVHEMGKKLSDGKGAVGFKKSAFKAKKKKQNRRTTSADDD
jgi:WW domain-binding protein 4